MLLRDFVRLIRRAPSLKPIPSPLLRAPAGPSRTTEGLYYRHPAPASHQDASSPLIRAITEATVPAVHPHDHIEHPQRRNLLRQAGPPPGPTTTRRATPHPRPATLPHRIHMRSLGTQDRTDHRIRRSDTASGVCARSTSSPFIPADPRQRHRAVSRSQAGHPEVGGSGSTTSPDPGLSPPEARSAPPPGCAGSPAPPSGGICTSLGQVMRAFSARSGRPSPSGPITATPIGRG